MIGLILLVFAFVFACIAAFWNATFGRLHFGWLAVAVFLLSLILGGATGLHLR